jgi:hypothetical protein
VYGVLNHLLHPLLLYAAEPQPAVVRMQRLNADAIPGITPLLRRRLLDAAATVEALGFAQPVYCVGSVDRRLDAVTALFERPDGRALAFVHAAEGAHTRMNVSFTLTTEFADGRQLATSNFSFVMRTPPRPRAKGLAIAECTDLARVWALHDHLARAHERLSPIRSMTRGDDPIGFELALAHTVADHWVASGYYVRLPDGRHKLTPMGATLAAWRGLWPWKHWVRRRDARQMATALREMVLHK